MISCLQRINDQFWWLCNENKTEHNKNWPYSPDHPYRILIIGDSGSWKTNVLLNLIENQPGKRSDEDINTWLIKEKV